MINLSQYYFVSSTLHLSIKPEVDVPWFAMQRFTATFRRRAHDSAIVRSEFAFKNLWVTGGSARSIMNSGHIFFTQAIR
jgi:hypothetical protein